MNGSSLIRFAQAAALAQQEKERVASEEAEKRLKAALTAKREPNISASRVASPNPGTGTENPTVNGEATGEGKPSAPDGQQMDVSMETAEAPAPAPASPPEVCSSHL